MQGIIGWSGCLLLLTTRLLVAAPAEGQEAAGQPPETTGRAPVEEAAEPTSIAPEPFLDVLHNHRLTGDWGGFRRQLEAKGFEFSLSLTSIYQHNMHGGLRTHHGHDFTGSVDTELIFDTEAMGLWKGGTFYVFGESSWNDGIENRVGSLLGVNGDAVGDEAISVREMWYEQAFWEDKLRIKLGKMDLAVDIDTNAYANWEVTQFLNGGLINTANIPLPDYGLGMVVGVQPVEWFYVTLAAADAQADGNETGFNTAFHDEDDFFSALELGLSPTWQTAWGALHGCYRFILWYDPQAKERFQPEPEDGRVLRPRYRRDDVGFAFNLDQMLYKERPADDADNQGLGVFFRYGYANELTNEIEHFWSGGAQYQGLVPTRDNDVLGFGFAQGIISDVLHDAAGGDRESVYELYYNIEVFPWLHITPDLQYIVQPGGDRSGRDACVAGVRVHMLF